MNIIYSLSRKNPWFPPRGCMLPPLGQFDSIWQNFMKHDIMDYHLLSQKTILVGDTRLWGFEPPISSISEALVVFDYLSPSFASDGDLTHEPFDINTVLVCSDSAPGARERLQCSFTIIPGFTPQEPALHHLGPLALVPPLWDFIWLVDSSSIPDWHPENII